MRNIRVIVSVWYNRKRIEDLARKYDLIYMVDYFVESRYNTAVYIRDIDGVRKEKKINFLIDLNEGF
jgi:hypothetical protein